MKRINFRATDKDVALIEALKNRLGLTLTAVIRQAVRLLAKKQLTLTLLLLVLLTGCGGSLNPINPPVVAASTNAPPPPFPFPSQPLTCSGDPLSPQGESCDESDGKTFYNHMRRSITIGANGHGTFQFVTETGTRGTGLYQFTFKFPQTIALLEVHPTLNIKSWCGGNGFETKWDGASATGGYQHVIGVKTYTDNSSGSTIDIPVPQTVFPLGIPLSEMYLYTYNDLCALSTISWDVTGSF